MAVRQYILSVICIVIACGLLQMLLAAGTAASVVKMISGLAVTVTVLLPLIKGDVVKWDIRFEQLVQDGESIISEGQHTASEMFKQCIKDKTESYILAKASDLGVSIDVSTNLASEYPNAPESLTLSGNISPYAKQRLCAYIAEEFGVPEEKQIWIS